MSADIADLLARVRAATGHDVDLDAAIDAELPLDGADAPAYTASVDACLALIGHALPGWHWHVGYGAKGVMPYARVSDRTNTHRAEATAATVPLALLDALLQAKLAEGEAGETG